MEGIHSFEQKSSYEIDCKRNRVILANRREPKVAWSTANLPIQSAGGCGGTTWFGLGRPADREAALGRTRSIMAGPFPSNEWRTSKYTLVNFLPKNLFEQFRRFANFYFLTTAILQIVLPFSPVGPTTSLLPLVFVVATTSIKQAYEDYLRHKMDKELNNRLCYVLRDKKLTKIRSKDIRVGDIVYVKNNEEIPCDMILLATGSGVSNTADRCYVTTANLDGETSLKSRNCSQILEQIGDIRQLDQTLLVIECEQPNATLYEFSGTLRAPKTLKAYELLVVALSELSKSESNVGLRPKRSVLSSKTSSGRCKSAAGPIENQKSVARAIMKQMSKHKSVIDESNPLRHQSNNSMSGYHEIPLDITNILLRASRLKNTSFVYGLVVYTGRDTKLAHNSQVKPNKFSSTETTVNNFLVIAFLILMTFSLIGTIRYKLLFVPSADKPNSEPFQEVLVAHFLLYNYLIPISLYVTLEFVKFFGTISVVEDKNMKAVVWRTVAVAAPSLGGSKSPANHRRPAISPATGGGGGSGGLHVTESKTSLRSSRQCQLEKPKCNSSDLNEELGQVEVLFSDKTGTLTENNMRFMACSIGGSMFRSINDQLYQQPDELYRGPVVRVAHKMARVKTNRSALITGGSISSHDGSLSGNQSGSHSGHSREQSRDKAIAFDHRKLPASEHLKLVDNMDQQERVAEFFICLCLCSTITINEQTPLAECLGHGIDRDFQSASPDEQSLIEAAHAVGVTMCKSNEKECFIVIERSQRNGARAKSQSRSPSKKRETGALRREPQKEQQLQQKDKQADKSRKFKALVEGEHSTDKYIVRRFKRLLEFEFSSLRKRMSVIYQDCDTDCLLMVTKGSEELLDCLRIDTTTAESEIDATLTHFEAFAKSGLRTLLVARRVLTSEEFELITAELKEAKFSIQNRDELTSAAYRRAENGLSLIGCTAVEDTLQDGVPETIANLKEAGIKVWLLTGDKVETAISVAYLCKLLDRNMTLFHLVRQQNMQACQRLLASFEHQLSNHLMADEDVAAAVAVAGGSRSRSRDMPRASFKSRGVKSPALPDNKRYSRSKQPLSREDEDESSGGTGAGCRFALVADGRSLHYAMKYAKEELAGLCKQCSCVLGCRLSPLQKAEVVDMIKQSNESPITAAIGDGANDVSMIQEAHVGIGISGKEGKQAVNCSDFAIGRFQMLNRLFFVHGHLFYHRTANIIHYFFYKNFLFILPQFLYSCYNSSSTRSLYHPIMLISFNLFFTSLPILVYGLLEVNIPERALETCPKFYTANRANSQLRSSIFFAWLSLATFQALLGFYLLQFSTQLLEATDNLNKDCINSFAVILYCVVVFTVTARLYSMAFSHNLYLNLSSAISCLALPSLLYGYSLLDLRAVISDNSLYGKVQHFLISPMFWLTLGTITSATILPDLIWFIRTRIVHFKWTSSVINECHEK